MITQRTIEVAQAAAELRQRGEHERAEAIDALLAATCEDAIPALDLLTSTQAGQLLGVSGQTIKNWVRDGRLSGFRVGSRIMIPKEIVSDYVRRARQSLELEDIPDEEAARLVGEGRAICS
jgi:excisionase family DNA binding protein